MAAPVPQTTLNALAALNVRGVGAPAPSASAEGGDGFQALLSLGVDAKDAGRDDRPAKDDRKEIIAAPVQAPTQIEKPQPEIKADNGDHDAHVRAYRNQNDDSSRTANDNAVEKSQPVKVEKNAADTSRASDASVDDAVSANDNPSSNDELADELRNRIDALSKVLDLLAALGGNPQEAQVKIESFLMQTTTIQVTQQTVAFTDAKFVGADGKMDIGASLQDIMAQLAALQDVMGQVTDENVNKTAPNFRALIHDIRQLSQYMNDQPELAGRWGNMRASMAQATRALIHQYKQMTAATQDMEVDVVADTGGKKSTVQASLFGKQGHNDLLSVAPNLSAQSASAPTSATIVAAAVASNAGQNDNQPNMNSNQNNAGQSLLQSVGGVKETGTAGGTQSVHTPSFARLLEQAKTPVLDQVMVHIKSGLADNKSEIKIQLQPEELGKLEIKLHVGADGKTGISVTADNKNTLDLLQRDSRGLERALSDAGLKADSGSLSFNLRGDQQNQTPEFAKSYKSPLPEDEDPMIVPAMVRSYVVNLTEGLDLTV